MQQGYYGDYGDYGEDESRNIQQFYQYQDSSTSPQINIVTPTYCQTALFQNCTSSSQGVQFSFTAKPWASNPSNYKPHDDDGKFLSGQEIFRDVFSRRKREMDAEKQIFRSKSNPDLTTLKNDDNKLSEKSLWMVPSKTSQSCVPQDHTHLSPRAQLAPDPNQTSPLTKGESHGQADHVK
jgi:hypothetical protein